MAIINRSKDITEQCEVISGKPQNQGVGFTAVIGLVPYPSNLKVVAFGGYGLSGAPSIELEVVRTTAGGITVITTIMAATAIRDLGISTSPIVLSGSSLPGATIALQAGDQLRTTLTGANTAVNQLAMDVVVQKIQDIVSYHGIVIS